MAMLVGDELTTQWLRDSYHRAGRGWWCGPNAYVLSGDTAALFWNHRYKNVINWKRFQRKSTFELVVMCQEKCIADDILINCTYGVLNELEFSGDWEELSNSHMPQRTYVGLTPPCIRMRGVEWRANKEVEEGTRIVLSASSDEFTTPTKAAWLSHFGIVF